MSKKPDRSPCSEDLACGAIVNKRNRWFTGKFMTARAYRIEQQHFLSHRWLHNRMLHGWGVAHGLKVIHHPDPECAKRWVVVRCGLAIDCCGRELTLMADTPFELPLPKATGDAGQPGDTGPPDDDIKRDFNKHMQRQEGPVDQFDDHEPFDDGIPDPDVPEPLLVCLRYGECETEMVPALHSESGCDPKRSEANFVVQAAVLDAAPLSSFDDGCWRLPGGGEDPNCIDDCGDDIPQPFGACFEPICPCGSCVPLALIVPANPEEGWEGGFEIDLDGRHEFPIPTAHLTHIAAINWPHGGELTLKELRNNLGRQLRVRFDRKLREADGEATGINEHTFTVQYGGMQKDLEFLSSRDEAGPGLSEGCTAFFEIDDRDLKGSRTIAGNTVYVTLKCDFILDCHGHPVDGDHLRARLPSGNGIPGGTFESWFRVVADSPSKEKKK